MRFGVLQEAETEIGSTHYFRIKELIREVQYAEEMGFDFWGTSEQHFVSPLATVTAPEVLYGYMAALTSRIRLRHLVALLPFSFNHPIRIAERIATLDLVSDGRAELGMGRANHLWQLDPFQIKPSDTRPQMLEALEIIDKALVLDEFEHAGPLLTIPRRRLSPKCLQQPRPPMFIIGTSKESHAIAGERGLGIVSHDNWRGWEHTAELAGTYQSAIQRAKLMTDGSIINPSMGWCALTCFCDESMDRAKEIAGPVAYSFFNEALEKLYLPLAEADESYSYWKEAAKELVKIREEKDVDSLLAHTPGILIGTPDDLIEKIKRLQKLGYGEMVLRVDGVGHENILNCLKLFGKYIIPEFQTPVAVVREYSVPGRIA